MAETPWGYFVYTDLKSKIRNNLFKKHKNTNPKKVFISNEQ